MKKILRYLFVVFCLFASMNQLHAQWVQTYKDGIICFAVSGSNLFAGNKDGVYLSTDNGTSWTTINNDLTATYISALAVSGTNIYAGTFGVFLSTNNGTNWTAVNNGLPYGDLITSLEVFGANIFAGTQGGKVFLSTNNGTNWTAITNDLSVTGIFALAVSGTDIYAGTDKGIFLSTNNGKNWTLVCSGIMSPYFDAFAVTNKYIFAGNPIEGVFRSTNDPKTWTALDQGLTPPYHLNYMALISLPELRTVTSFFRPMTVKVGLLSIPV